MKGSGLTREEALVCEFGGSMGVEGRVGGSIGDYVSSVTEDVRRCCLERHKLCTLNDDTSEAMGWPYLSLLIRF